MDFYRIIILTVENMFKIGRNVKFNKFTKTEKLLNIVNFLKLMILYLQSPEG
jgi:hypothetical protein